MERTIVLVLLSVSQFVGVYVTYSLSLSYLMYNLNVVASSFLLSASFFLLRIYV